MNPEVIILSEIRQTEKDKYHYDLTYMWNLKTKQNKKPSSLIQRTDYWLPEVDAGQNGSKGTNFQ